MARSQQPNPLTPFPVKEGGTENNLTQRDISLHHHDDNGFNLVQIKRHFFTLNTPFNPVFSITINQSATHTSKSSRVSWYSRKSTI
jgi:hypothetical protein